MSQWCEDEMKKMIDYNYRASGLDNVTLVGMKIVCDDDGDECITIPNINGLHKAIATAIVNRLSGMSGKELRFLRTLMGKTQAELAAEVHREGLAVGRWERGEIPIEPNAEALIRLMVRENLGVKLDARVDQITGWCIQSAVVQPIKIDASNPEDYHPLAA
jgi:transcriptional regulator with XRE-family HTH domain